MEITLENIYSVLEENKASLNFVKRDDVVVECGTSRFCSLIHDRKKGVDDIPQNILDFLLKTFNIEEKDYHFIQIQKYEIGEYILPHIDCYPNFGLLSLSTSLLDGLVLENTDGVFEFIPDVTGKFTRIPGYRWHWVNPVREKTRYTAVYGMNPIKDYDNLLNQ